MDIVSTNGLGMIAAVIIGIWWKKIANNFIDRKYIAALIFGGGEFLKIGGIILALKLFEIISAPSSFLLAFVFVICGLSTLFYIRKIQIYRGHNNKNMEYKGIKCILESEKIKEISRLNHEVFMVLYILHDRIIMHPRLNRVGNAVRVPMPSIDQIIEGCHEVKTNKVVVVHNHPYVNGKCSPGPSPEDIDSTYKLIALLNKSKVKLIDHIIVSQNGGFFSFRLDGLVH